MTASTILPDRSSISPAPRPRAASEAATGLDPAHPTWLFPPLDTSSAQGDPSGFGPAVSAARKRVLVVDNEPASTRMVRLTLERSGLFDICEVNDPLRALATARRFQPNLILLDIEMPGLDGSGVAAQLRDDDTLRKVPILFMTSLVTPEEADQQIYAAGSRVLAKPVTISKLMRSVAEILGNIIAPGNRPASAL